MLTTVTNALALLRLGGGFRGGGFFLLLVELAVVGAIIWALTRSTGPESAKDPKLTAGESPAPRPPE